MADAPALITGAPGWLGTRLVRALALGLSDVPALQGGFPGRLLRVLSQPGQDTGALKAISPKVELAEGDLNDPAALSDFLKNADGATVFHCAGLIHPTRGVKELYAVNVEGTRSLLRAARQAGARRLIYVSSSAVCGFNQGPGAPMDESTPCRPFMNYGRSKMQAEEIVREAADALETVIVRAPWFHGPGQPARQTRFFSAIRRGRFPIVGTGENLRSMVYIDNLCQALLLCERTPAAAGRTYWIADARPYAQNEIIATVERAIREAGIPVAGKRPRLPAAAARIGHLLDTVLQGLGSYRPEFHVLGEINQNIFCSIARAQKELGYQPAVDLYEGTRRALQWLSENGIEI